MFVRSTRFGLAFVLGVAAATSLASCGGGGGGAGDGGAQLVTLLTTSLPSATTGVPFSAQFTADFPNAPGRFLVTGGALPPGLTLDNQTGLLTGYPRQNGVFSFRIAARDGVDTALPPDRDATFAQDTGDFQMVVAVGPPNILPQQPPAAQYRASYGYQIDVAGGTAPFVFQQVGGLLPNGLTVSTSGLLGTFPQQEKPDGSAYEFDVRVTDANGLQDTATLSVDVVVLPLLILTTSPLTQAAAGFPYSKQMELASAGAGAPIAWSQVTPAMGETLLSTIGMEITTGGLLRNAAPNPGPTSVGTFVFTVRVTDEAGQATTRQFSLKINAGPVLTSINPSKAVASPPFVLTGLNFQPGAVVIFKPGANQVQVNPSTNSPTQLTLNATPPTPGGGGGFVTVRVLNPDGGFSDLPAAFAFPATNLTFSGTPTFPSPQSSLSSTGLAVGDVNKDGFADVVHVGSQGSGSWATGTPTSGGVHLMLNTPAAGVFNGSFSQLILNAGGDFQAVKIVDIDLDGDLDIVAMGRISGTLRIRTWRNPYPAAYTAATPFVDTVAGYDAGYHMGNLETGRITNPDVVPDLAYTQQTYPMTTSSAWDSYAGQLTTMRGAGDGSFTATIQSVTDLRSHYAMTDVVLADFDNDGYSDAFVGDQAGGKQAYSWGTGGTYGASGMAGTLDSGSGLFGSWVPLTRSGGINQTIGVAAGDVNGDGNADILAANSDTWSGFGGTTGLGVFQGNGSAGYSSVVPGSVSGRPRFAAVFDADFDYPGDVAVTIAENKIDIFKGRTGSLGLQFRQSLTVTGSPKLGRVATGDFNNDGRNDVCAAMSFFADAVMSNLDNYGDRGNGSPTGVVIFLNTSN